MSGMRDLGRWGLVLAGLLTGCAGGGSDTATSQPRSASAGGVAAPEGAAPGDAALEGAAPEGAAPRDAAPGGAAAPQHPVTPGLSPTTEPYTPTRALPEITVANPGAACAALPAPRARESEARAALRPYAVAVRRLACEPELYGKTSAELARALDLPADADLDFSGLRSVRLKLPEELSVGDLAAVFGIADPQIHVTWQAYHALTFLGTNATTGDFDLWGPGAVSIGVGHEVPRYGEDEGIEKIIPAPAELSASSWVYVGMPERVVGLKPDPDAIPLLVSALGQLAARPALLSGEPSKVKEEIGLSGERFRVSETSSRSEGKVTRGVGINPRRTTVPAAALADALGLVDAKAYNVNAEHDVWHIEAAGTTQIAWNGLELEFEVSSPESDDLRQPLGALEVEFVFVMPLGY